MGKTEQIPATLQERYDEITGLTNQFCQQHLNEQYRDLCRRMAVKLCHKRPSPIATGKTNTWACGIVYLAGRVNFLFDKNQTLHMQADELCRYFDFNPKIGSTKSTAIMELLKCGRPTQKRLISVIYSSFARPLELGV
ncbi:DUF6398 domain-containing protein [Nitrosomonas sp. Is37]|uniref:DUF6398 domain-containing protein n=1 Tax=Nitrosomonas sp. Is37 TaxID=3080535 RepID=UPI00294B7E10|nr:DUF6398 domain-containing protein [Nitrosomonas sp. Is37]MDV6345143.1 DUF6398 domain-containing protein [Nitrosomonas sp. Is37]